MKKKSLLIISLLFTSCHVLPMQKIVLKVIGKAAEKPERVEQLFRFCCPCIASIVITGVAVRAERVVQKYAKGYINMGIDAVFGKVKTD